MYSVTYPDYSKIDYSSNKPDVAPVYTQARPQSTNHTRQYQQQCNVPPQPCYLPPCPPAHVQQARILARHGINSVKAVTVPTFVHTNKSSYKRLQDSQSSSRSSGSDTLQCCAPPPVTEVCTCRPRPQICRACNPKRGQKVYPGRQSWPLRGNPSKVPARSSSFTSRRTAASGLCPPSEDEGALSDTYLAVRFGSRQSHNESHSDRETSYETKNKTYRNHSSNLCLPEEHEIRQRRASDSQMRLGSTYLDHPQHGLPRTNARSNHCLPSCTMHITEERTDRPITPQQSRDHKASPCIDPRSDCCMDYRGSNRALDSKSNMGGDLRSNSHFDTMGNQYPEVILDSCLAPRSEHNARNTSPVLSPRYESQSSPRFESHSRSQYDYYGSSLDPRLSPRLSPRSESRYAPRLDINPDSSPRIDPRISPQIIEPRPDVCASPSYDMRRNGFDRLQEMKSNAQKFFEDIAEFNNNKSEDSSSDMPDDFRSQQAELHEKYEDIRENNRVEMTQDSSQLKPRINIPADPREDHLNTGYESGPEIAVGLEDPPWYCSSDNAKVNINLFFK